MKVVFSVALLFVALPLASSCSRRCSSNEIPGTYVVAKANPVWAKHSDYTQADLDRLRLQLRTDGGARLTCFPHQGKVSGVGSWSMLKPGVVYLLITEHNTVVPMGAESSGDEVRLLYSDDPELPTNLVLKKVPDQPPLRMPVSGTPAADALVAPSPGIAGR